MKYRKKNGMRLFSIRSMVTSNQTEQREILRTEGEDPEEVRERLRDALSWCGIIPSRVAIVEIDGHRAGKRRKGRANIIPASEVRTCYKGKKID